jgi:hypothetical protein
MLQSMAGGVMSQVQGIIPGMRRGGEEEVPDPAPQEEYQEYQVMKYQIQYLRRRTTSTR